MSQRVREGENEPEGYVGGGEARRGGARGVREEVEHVLCACVLGLALCGM